ncbi:MAG: 50S ribosomal protein L18 [Candidatus Pacebacteria bacterium]|nr:50S ribosomal protein L18 [Candidatus Paceibacterota bacterium]NUQ57182.1 50S ribosomal protein L18 [Candidatus Paceibacter sp.]
MKRLISKKEIRHKRIRAKIAGTAAKPRLSVFRSNRHIFAQLIDDEKGVTLVSAGDLKKGSKVKKTDSAKNVGLELAKAAKAKKIEAVMFDRGGFRYHGRVRAVAEGAREGGLKF